MGQLSISLCPEAEKWMPDVPKEELELDSRRVDSSDLVLVRAWDMRARIKSCFDSKDDMRSCSMFTSSSTSSC